MAYTPPTGVDLLTSLERQGVSTFYMQYFQTAGVAEAELEADVEATIRRVSYSMSGDGPGRIVAGMLAPGAGFLDTTVEPNTLPAWLPALPRLSWLAFGGNPFSAGREHAALTHTPLPPVPWHDLRIEEQLGEGASGVIHRAQRRNGGAAIALKVFKGEVTSDGSPSSEMAACLQGGAHANLIPVLGRLTEHPAQAEGLAMQLIPPEFRTLAGPPSLDSCTRDVYAPETRFDLARLHRLAGGIASAVRHLHQRGISHGDLYAHNILHDGQGTAVLGDFGAASFFEPETASAKALQRLEARAFGCLLEELMERCDTAAPALQALRDACLSDDPARRPLFDEIERAVAHSQIG